MNFNIISIFPESFKSYFALSMLKRGLKKNLIKINLANPRDFASDKPGTKLFLARGGRQTVDDKPYGGGPGMVIKAEPILRTVESVKQKTEKRKQKIIVLSPAGRQFTQKMARDWAKKYKNITLICGHYEGIDERVQKITRAEKISVGPYILTGGELAAMIIVDAVSRHIPGILGKEESLEEKRFPGLLENNRSVKNCQGREFFLKNGAISCPVYTRPEIIIWNGKKYRVPKILLSGDHKKIQKWKMECFDRSQITK